jgi:hypothetical protein
MRVVMCVSFDRDKEREGLCSATVRPRRKSKLEGEKSLLKFVWNMYGCWRSSESGCLVHGVGADDARDDGMACWEVTACVRSGRCTFAFSRVTSRFKEGLVPSVVQAITRTRRLTSS